MTADRVGPTSSSEWEDGGEVSLEMDKSSSSEPPQVPPCPGLQGFKRRRQRNNRGKESQTGEGGGERGDGKGGENFICWFIGTEQRGEDLVPARAARADPWVGQLPSLPGLSLQTPPGAGLPGGWQELTKGQWQEGAGMVLLQPPTPSSSEDQETRA